MATKPLVRGVGESCRAVPFATSEEAWLWYTQCQAARDDGARFIAGLGLVPRPCDPDDIIREVRRLFRQRRLEQAHMAVLGCAGLRTPPHDPWSKDPKTATRLWDEALDRLETPLRNKGIIT